MKKIQIKILKTNSIGIIFFIILNGFFSSSLTYDVGAEDNYTFPEYRALIIAPDWWDIHSQERGMFYEEVLLTYGSNWKEENIISLYGETPTRNSVIQAIDTIAENDNPDDTTLIIIVSHGGYWENIGKGDFSVKDYSFPYSELDDELDKLSSEKIGIIISACHSGSAIPDLQDNGRVIFTSCKAEDTGGLDNQVPLGLQGFADYCINSGNKNGIITMNELFEYSVYEKYSCAYGKYQFQDNCSEDLIINVLKPENKMDQIPSYTYEYDGNGSGHVKTQFVNNELWEDEVAQSFRPLEDTLSRIGLRIKNCNSQSPITVSIRKELDGIDLTSKTMLPSEIAVQSNSIINKKYTIINFPNINVIPGDTYYIVCKIAEPMPDMYSSYFIEGRSDNCYSRGNSYIRSASYQGTLNPEWISKDDTDFLFFTNYHNFDDNPPTTTHKIKGQLGDNSWYVSATKIALLAIDDISGVDKIYYKINQGIFQLYEQPIILEKNGIHKISFYSIDKAGNKENLHEITIKIDINLPTTRINLESDNSIYFYNGPIIISLNAIDTSSGIKDTYYRIDTDEKWSIYKEFFIVSDYGTHVIDFFSVDKAGNKEIFKSITFSINNIMPIKNMYEK